MSHLQIITLSVLGATACLLGLYDVWVKVRGGDKATISKVLLNFAKRYPIVPLALGVILGHIFWTNC